MFFSRANKKNICNQCCGAGAGRSQYFLVEAGAKDRLRLPAPAPPQIKQTKFSMIFSSLVPTSTMIKSYLKNKYLTLNEIFLVMKKRRCFKKKLMAESLLYLGARAGAVEKNTRSRSKMNQLRNTVCNSVSDPDPYWIRIQGSSGFGIRIRIQGLKKYFKKGQIITSNLYFSVTFTTFCLSIDFFRRENLIIMKLKKKFR